MSFFDKKEETLDLKLTPYGRYLLSVGKLMPKYYAFLDDEVIYDSDCVYYANESNHEVKERIINETPSLKPLITFNSVESTIGDSFVSPEDKILDIQMQEGKISLEEIASNATNNYKNLADFNTKFLQYTIGTCDSLKTKSPSWNIINFSGEITNAANTIESTVNGMLASTYKNDIDTPSINLNIPQIDVAVAYELTVGSIQDAEHNQYMESLSSAEIVPPQVYPNGTYLKIKENQLLSRILEDNGFEFNEAFDIQVFTNNPGAVNNTWKKLKFANKPNNIVKDILMDLEDEIEFNPLEVTEDIVEYYFDLRVDEEIPLRDICKNASNLEGFEKELYELGIDIDVDCKDFITSPGTPPSPEPCKPECPPDES